VPNDARSPPLSRDRYVVTDEMTEDEARAALRSAGVWCVDVRTIPGGWASWTFEADRRWIVRFPRDATVARGHERERRLLPELAAVASFAVPVPGVVGMHRGLPFHVYEKLPGHPLRPGELAPSDVAKVLASLHAFPVARARQLLEDPGTAEHWFDGLRALWPQVRDRVLPLLAPDVAASVRVQFGDFLATARFDPVLIHGDLDCEHFLVGPEIGLIDFEDVAIGDAACDLAGLANSRRWDTIGGAVTYVGAAARAYPATDLDFPARLRFYWWMAAVHELMYALEVGDERVRAEALEKLTTRVRDRRRVCAAVIRGDQIVVVEEEGLFWWLPGGGVEPGERDEDAVLRELNEETGMSGRVIRLLYERTHLRGTERCFLVASDDEPVVGADELVTGARWTPLTPETTDWQLARVVRALAPPAPSE
jgi:aminoglycoside phosphotransferase (APT) family kinase protein/ADP-ribose pyrophosphatase YjhB (NUDIX family)